MTLPWESTSTSWHLFDLWPSLCATQTANWCGGGGSGSSCCLMAALAPLKRHGWVVVGGSLEQVFQVHVDSHTPPPRRRNNIQRHTQQTGWRSPRLQPFLGTPLPSAPPFLVWGILKRGGAHGRSVISVCICVRLWRLNPTELLRDEKHMQRVTAASMASSVSPSKLGNVFMCAAVSVW